ncbi:TPA: peptidylprolyl isomerase [Candidatus Avigastranaerophilus faecigallinarum]|nr:peptidylprolyl isomerase [Candidatus Avigastranaerophilus faecigallinarum]
MNKLKVTIFALLAMFVFTGCSLKKSDNDLIKINHTVITKSEFDKAYESVTTNNMFSQMGIDLKKDPDNVFALMLREKVVSELIVKALLNEEMEKNKIAVTKEEIENAEKDIIGKFGSKEQFMQVLKINGVTYDKFKKDIEEEIKLKKFVDSIAMVSVGESEAKKYYNENLDKFKYPKRVRASHILIAANPEQIAAKIKEDNKEITDEELAAKVSEKMNELKKKAEVLQAKVKKVPSSFAKVAKENSQDTASAIRGGDLGFFAKEEMVESFANKAFSMAPNTISEVVQTPYGFHIIMVTDRNEAGVLSFEQSKKDIINYLESLDKVDILKNKIETLRKDAKIEYYDEAYNPENIQKKIKESAKSNPAMQQFGEQNQKTNKK